jgi:hypothetical protein
VQALRREQAITTKLSIETETIGEYVVLYQEHRAALQQRVAAKDDYIRRCTAEIALLTQRVTNLQAVVSSLHTPSPTPTNSLRAPMEEVNTAVEALPNAELDKLMAPVGIREEWFLQSCACCSGRVIHI